MYKSRYERSERHFCDGECRGEWMSDNRTGENHPQWTRESVECYWCGDGVELPKWKREAWERHFCSSECEGKWRSNERVGEDHHNYKPERHETTDCDYCGDEFNYHLSKSEGIYCSYTCRALDKGGEDHPRWSGGRIDYGEGWTEEKREKVRKRAGYECARCGKGQDETLEESNRKLHVHHIKPAKQVDDPEERNDVDNLAALCISCHASIETRSEEVLS